MIQCVFVEGSVHYGMELKCAKIAATVLNLSDLTFRQTEQALI